MSSRYAEMLSHREALGTLSKDDDDGSENVVKKMNLRSFKPEAYNPEAYNSVAKLGFFREPIKIFFLIWNY